jgi:hypothetical protein
MSPSAARPSATPDAATLVAAAQYLDVAWDQWVEADDGDAVFAIVEEAVGNLRRVLAGIRRMRARTDSYGFLRARCACRWSGSPWTQGDPMIGNFASARQQATAEFVRHACNQMEGES